MRKSKKHISESYDKNSVYRTIEDCPIWNWIKIQETGDLKYLGDLPREELEEIYLSMQDEIFKTFGVNQRYKDYLQLLKEKARLLNEVIQTNDPFTKLDLHVIEEDISMLFNSKEKQEFDEVVVLVEKYMGFQLDPKKISVKKYYSYLKTIEKHGKAD